jgi:hypothetical protein
MGLEYSRRNNGDTSIAGVLETNAERRVNMKERKFMKKL